MNGTKINGSVPSASHADNGQAQAAPAVNGVNLNGVNGTKVNGTPSQSPVPIAICGMAMRLPAGIRDDQALYDFLINKGDARSVVPADRYNIDAFYSPDGKPGTVITKHGYFLGKDVDFTQFDHSMFTAGASEADHMDPNQRLMLEVVREALERAGEDWRGKPIGTYVGLFTEDWQEMHHKDSTFFHPYFMMGTLDFALANRISYEYDLRGPSVMYKTACSSAGVGLHEALEAIRQGSISSALVVGSNLIMAPGLTVSMSLLMALSPEGSSKSFDASADGYARGEAVTALYIKRLDHALRDGNPVRAVIRASASNADGRSEGGMAHPSADAHEAAMRKAYASAGLDMAQTAMVEAHGTGTPAGDPIEASAIAKCFGEQGVYIGAVKPNLGHSEGAAAITGIMKAVLSLENRTIIPNIKFKNPNPAIPWEAAKLKVPVEPTPWPQDRHERMSVNSYGIGGSNCHFILDSAASFGVGLSTEIPRAIQQARPEQTLLLFSGARPEVLQPLANKYQAYISKNPGRLSDIAYTLAERRQHLKHRAFCVADGVDTWTEPVAFASQEKDTAAFVFTGQGAQWVHMGRQLLLDYPDAMKNFKAMDQILASLGEHAPSWTLEQTILETADSTELARPEIAQPICTAVQIMIVDLLASCGVHPKAVVGHSSGEIAAAYAAGALSKEEAILTAFYRGYVCKKPQQMGAMAAVGMGKDEVTPFLRPELGVTMACENSASSVTLSGNADGLDKVLEAIRAAKAQVFARKLQVKMAYHSDHMRLVGDSYQHLLEKVVRLSPREPKIPMYSSVYEGQVLTQASSFGPSYWKDNLENPVLFRGAVGAMLADLPQAVHVEIGPHHALQGPLRQIYQEHGVSVQHIPTLVRGENDTHALLSTLGKLFSAGMPIRLPRSDDSAPAPTVLSDLPAYPWHYERSYWNETRVMRNWRFRKHRPHDLLGTRTIESTDLAPSWRNEIRLENVPWLKDHMVGTDIVFPGAGYLAMAGEAAFQLGDDGTGTHTRDYTVKEVELRQALVLLPDGAKELVTTLRPQRLTTSLNSDWYEFEIVSHDGSAWSKHCSGLVRRGRASQPPPKALQKPAPLPRKVSSRRWYVTLSRVGLNYGPRFTGLRNITAGVDEMNAVLDLTDEVGDSAESRYPMHPATLDIMLQSWTIAAFRGIYGAFTQPFLPTFIQELYVGDARPHGESEPKNIHVRTWTRDSGAAAGRQHSQGESLGISEDDGSLMFWLKGFEGTRLPSDDDSPELTALQLQWKPDVTFLDEGKLMRPTYDFGEQVALAERLYILCALESHAALQGVASSQPHQEKYRSWMASQIPRFSEPDYPLVPDAPSLVALSSQERRDLIPGLLQQCIDAGVGGMATSVWRTYDQVVNVFGGTTDFLELLIHDGTLASIYDWMNAIWDLSDLFQLLGHLQPQMRVLEIGAGTGGLTARILKQLQSEYGERTYFQYTFTDISAGFFPAAQERFSDYANIEYKVLDVSKNPLDQGFDPGSYDLIIASNVLHATPILHETLTNVRTLLHPEGRLFLQELSPITSSMVYIMGLFSGWWLGEADGRADAPYLPVEEWDKKLRAAGFNGCETVTYDNEPPRHVNANIISRPADVREAEQDLRKEVSLLSGPSGIHPLARQMEEELTARGYTASHYVWGESDQPTNDNDLISFVDLEEHPLLANPTQEQWQTLRDLVGSIQQASVLWLTKAAQVEAQDPHAGLILGLVRTIRSELAISFATMELDDCLNANAATAVTGVLEKLSRATKDQRDRPADYHLDPDMEYALVDGVVHISRFHWFGVPQALRETGPKEPDTKALTIRKRGLLETLEWTGQGLPELRDDFVQTNVKAVGMNFTDVLIAMGLVHGVDALGSGFDTFGLEGAGYVSKVGKSVSHVKVGDRVVILGVHSAGLATQVQRSGAFTLRIPDTLSFEDAATMPSVYVTVLLGLVEKARLAKGQSILIHAAAGGIGIAAIQVARWIGADIYCTVGSEDKAKFLVEQMNVPRERIFRSRDTSFREDLLSATNGMGVDCVLNSVAGELLHATWDCVAPTGSMVEIGKRDMIGKARLALDKFEDNRTFYGIDVSRLALQPGVASRLMALMIDLYANGHIQPIHPTTIFEAERVEDAFRYMQQGTHVGKIVVRMPDDESKLDWSPVLPKPTFAKDKSYLLVGGMGGLGKAIAIWMATHGAGNLIFLSRSAGTTEDDRDLVAELELMGCTAQTHAGSVADTQLVTEVVKGARLPIAGVMQMAMILRDMGVLDMDLDTYQAVLAPRVTGTWNLHHALLEAECPLDFFVLFSSVCGTVGYYGQANYAASNAFLDAFAQYRRAQGLCASVLDIGAVDDVGYISRTPAAKDSMMGMAGRLITEMDFLDALHLTVARSSTSAFPMSKLPSEHGGGVHFQNPSQVTQALECRLPIMDPANNIIWKRDPRMALYRNVEAIAGDGGGAGSAAGMRNFLAAAAEDPSRLDSDEAAEFLAGQIRDRVAAFLLKDGDGGIELGWTLSQAGVDSLVAIELRNWWKQNVGGDVSVLELMNGGSFLRLGGMAAGKIRERLGR